MGAHRWSGGAGEAFAVLGAGAGFGHGRTVGLLPLEETRGKRGQGIQRARLTQRGPELELTRPGSSQHLSLLAHTVLQAISNIWSWNWRHTSMRVKAGRAGAPRAAEDLLLHPHPGLRRACDPPAGVLLQKNLPSCCLSSEEPEEQLCSSQRCPPVLTGAELSLFPRERTILPRTSTPSVLMFPAAVMLFSATALQSITTLALVLLMATCS